MEQGENIDKLYPSSLSSHDRVACLVSGGVDSMVLLTLLDRYRLSRCPYQLTIIHFNYHLRGEESDRDERFVRSETAKKGIPLVVVDAPLPSGSGVQERAREIRRKRVVELARDRGWTVAATGHHADDQLETVLMRMVRGAGDRGLRGIDREGSLAGGLRVVRPLLSLTREAILGFATREGIPFVEDSSNKKDLYFRNRIRRQIVPQLKKEFPHLMEELSNHCALYQERFLRDQRLAETFVETYSFPIPIGRYFQLSETVRFLVLERFLKESGFEKEVNQCHRAEIEELMKKGNPVSRLYGRAVFFITGGFFSFHPFSPVD